MPQISSKNHPNKIMKKTLKTIIATLSLLLITSVISINGARAEEVKKQNKTEIQNQKITYTKAEEETVLKKIDDLNKNNNLEYGKYLTRREMLIRLDMMKKKYPINWYLDMMKGFDFNNCEDVSYLSDYHCAQDKILYQVSQDKIISVLLHYDDLSADYFRLLEERDEFSYPSYMIHIDSFMDIFMLTHHLDSYVEHWNMYSINKIGSMEISGMIKNKIILNAYRAYLEKEKDDCHLSIIRELRFNN